MLCAEDGKLGRYVQVALRRLDESGIYTYKNFYLSTGYMSAQSGIEMSPCGGKHNNGGKNNFPTIVW